MTELDSIANYIVENYGDASKIVEVGVGELARVMAKLRDELPDCELIVTDVEEPSNIPSGVHFEEDDITKPNLEVYEGSDLIYSIKTPQELQSSLIKVSGEVGADLLIKPVSSEEIPPGGKLTNYQGVAFHLFKPTPSNSPSAKSGIG